MRMAREDIKTMVVEAITEAFREEPPEALYSYTYWVTTRSSIRGALQKAVLNIVSKETNKQVLECLNKQVNPEQFIDDIVARIKSKQL